MISLKAKTRSNKGKKSNKTREAGKIPAVVYGPGVKNVSLEIDYKDFQKVFKETGESSLVELLIEGEKHLPAGRQEKRLVLIHEIQKDPVSDKFLHVDFFQASLKEEVEVTVPLVFEGTSLAIKELGGTLIKNITEIEVKALPQNLPHEIKVFIDRLNNFGDHILIKDLILPKDIKVLKKPDEIIVSVAQPQKVEEELEKPVEEDVSKVEKVEKEKKEEEIVAEPKE